MNRQQIGTKLTLDALGVSLGPRALETFDERLIVQKAIYLAKAAEVDCGHYFRWYLRGPYSPELTSDAFSMQAEIAAGLDESAGWVLDPEVAMRLNRVKNLIPGGDRASIARKLELLASVHFLVDRRQVPYTDPKSIEELLMRYGKDFSEDEVARALSELRDNEFLPK